VAGDPAVAGVEAEDDLVREPTARLFEPVRLPQGARAEHDALHAPAERLADVVFAAEAAAELAGEPGGLDDAAHAGAVDRPALRGAVEVDEVQVSRPLSRPPAGHRGGVAAEDRFLAVIPLPQPDALPAAQVDGRKDEHRGSPESKPCRDVPKSVTVRHF